MSTLKLNTQTKTVLFVYMISTRTEMNFLFYCRLAAVPASNLP